MPQLTFRHDIYIKEKNYLRVLMCISYIKIINFHIFYHIALQFFSSFPKIFSILDGVCMCVLYRKKNSLFFIVIIFISEVFHSSTTDNKRERSITIAILRYIIFIDNIRYVGAIHQRYTFNNIQMHFLNATSFLVQIMFHMYF